jgi:hypothetical protein
MKMKSGLLTFLLLIIVSATLISCKESEQSTPQGRYQATDDSTVFYIVDEAYLNGHITVLNSPLEIAQTSQSVQKTSRRGKTKGDPVDDVALSLVAETSAVTLANQTVQATDVALKENKAYISYNMAGDEFVGALQVVDLKKESSPSVLAEIIFEDIDINALYIKGNELYAVGAADPASRSISTPAVLIIVSLKHGIPQASIDIIDLPSYAGTDVLVKNGYIFVTVGADGGGLVRLKESDPNSYSVDTDFIWIDDARSLAVEARLLGVLKGTDGQISYFNTSELTSAGSSLSSVNPVRDVAFSGTATIANSKSTIDMVSELSIVALGDGGIKAIFSDSNDDTPLFEIAAVTGYGDLADALTVTNAVTVNQNLLFRASGEAGVDLYKLSKKIRSVPEGGTVSLTRLGSLEFDDLSSANGIFYRHGFLFVANGLGGMKIVRVDRDYQSTSDEAEDDAELDLDDEDDA